MTIRPQRRAAVFARSPHPHVEPGIDPGGNGTLEVSARIIKQDLVLADINAKSRVSGRDGADVSPVRAAKAARLTDLQSPRRRTESNRGRRGRATRPLSRKLPLRFC
jgi:hypothetical protein